MIHYFNSPVSKSYKFFNIKLYIIYVGCEPSKIWMLIRHGTRNPNAKLIRKMNERLQEIQQLILDGNLEELTSKSFFQNWKPNISEDDMKKLTHEGEEEMLHLAKRMQNRLPNLFPKLFTNSSYQVSLVMLCGYVLICVVCSLSLLLHNEQKRVLNISLRDCLEVPKLVRFGFQCLLLRTPFCG